jgi:hypothetical protein
LANSKPGPTAMKRALPIFVLCAGAVLFAAGCNKTEDPPGVERGQERSQASAFRPRNHVDARFAGAAVARSRCAQRRRVALANAGTGQ